MEMLERAYKSLKLESRGYEEEIQHLRNENERMLASQVRLSTDYRLVEVLKCSL
jgi:hypothetical protein